MEIIGYIIGYILAAGICLYSAFIILVMMAGVLVNIWMLLHICNAIVRVTLDKGLPKWTARRRFRGFIYFLKHNFYEYQDEPYHITRASGWEIIRIQSDYIEARKPLNMIYVAEEYLKKIW